MSRAKGTGQPGPKGWPGIGVRILATLFFLVLVAALNRCSLPRVAQDQPTGVTPGADAPRATLRVEVQPSGAHVTVDDLRSGFTPVSLELPTGRHEIRVELEGYEPLVQTVDLTAGGATLSGELLAIEPGTVSPTRTPTSTPEPGGDLPLPDLVVKYARIELQTGGRCDYTSTQLGVRVGIENVGNENAGPFVVEVNGVQRLVDKGLGAGQTLVLWFEGYTGQNTIVLDATLQVAESNEENNIVSQMLPIPTLPLPCTRPPAEPPTNTPTPSALPVEPPTSTPTAAIPPTETSVPSPPTLTPTPSLPPAAVIVREGQTTIRTYPYASFLAPQRNEIYNLSYLALDRPAYEASNPVPASVTYRTLEMENEYLKLTFLPDLGGRIYEVFFKPTGHRETYRNAVLKPSPWGPPEQGWWLAAGGIEWCLPVVEHGYEWGTPWTAQVSQDSEGATILLRDTTATDRVRAEIAVRLEAGAGSFSIQPRLENPTDAPLTMSYWTNAALAPGGQNSPSADLRFVLPDAVTAVTVHSRGDDDLPAYNERMSWPVYNGTDYGRLGNWNRWLGFFEDPAVGNFVAVYDGGYDEGMVRVASPDVTKGVKVFAFGWSDPIPASNWTDDGSSYVEVHGGPAPTFDDNIPIPAGSNVQWTEIWYPVAGLGGLRYANGVAALNLSAGNSTVEIAVAVTRSWLGDAVLLLNGQERWRETVSLLPGQVYSQAIALGDGAPQTGRLALRLQSVVGSVDAEYSAEFRLK